jgi:hypothetical protein
MLDTSPDKLLNEIRTAEQIRKRHMANTTQLLKRFVGNWYRQDMRTKDRPENLIFSFVAQMLPNLVFDNPGVCVSAKRAISHAAIATAMQLGMNGWVKEVELRTELEMLAVDFLFSFACAKVGIEARGDFNGDVTTGVQENFGFEALSPYAVRVPPQNVVIDPRATHWKKARFIAEQLQRDLASLQGDERYDQAVVAKLSADDEQPIGRSSAETAVSGKTANEENRDRVTLYEIYIPETREIGTLAMYGGDQSAWVRPLTPFHGPREGPFVFFGVYFVPNQVYPLSPIAAMAEQDDELNAHAAAAAEEAATGKSLALVSADQPELANQIRKAGNNSVVTVKGLNSNMVVPLAIGGTTPQRIEYLNLLLQRTDRISGQSEAARGKAQGVTATEAQLANANGDARTEFLHLKYTDGVKDVLKRVGWYTFHDPAVVMPVSDVDPTTGQPFEGLFLGGPQPGQEDVDWSGFLLDIEPYSMRRRDPQMLQQQVTSVTELVTTILPIMPTMPWVNWQAILDLWGQALNMPDFAQTVLNQQGMMLMQQGMLAAPMGGGAQPGPGDVPGGVPAPAGLQTTPRPLTGAQQSMGQRFPGPTSPAGVGGGAGGPAAMGAAA